MIFTGETLEDKPILYLTKCCAKRLIGLLCSGKMYRRVGTVAELQRRFLENFGGGPLILDP